jgi:hypothetical protein
VGVLPFAAGAFCIGRFGLEAPRTFGDRSPPPESPRSITSFLLSQKPDPHHEGRVSAEASRSEKHVLKSLAFDFILVKKYLLMLLGGCIAIKSLQHLAAFDAV